MPRCAIFSCLSDMRWRHESPGLTGLHRIPKIPHKHQRWMDALSRAGAKFIGGNKARFCSLHFKESDFRENNGNGKRTLKKNAVPSLKLVEEAGTTSANQTNIEAPWTNHHDLTGPADTAKENQVTSIDFPACCRLCLKSTKDDPRDVIPCEQIHPESGFTVYDLLLEMSFEPSVNESSSPQGSICQSCYCKLQNVYQFRSQCTEMHKFYAVLVEAKETGSEEPLVELIERETSDKLRSHLVRLGIISSDNIFIEVAETGFVSSETEPDETFEPQETIENETDIETDTGDDSRSEDNVEPPAKDAEYRLQSSRDSHRRKHKLLPLVCDSCGEVFAHKTYLKRHIMYKHTKNVRYVCEFCKIAFTTSSDLSRHRRIHTKESPYRCIQCGDQFMTNEQYNRHVQINAGLEVHQRTYHHKRSIQQSTDEDRAADVQSESLES